MQISKPMLLSDRHIAHLDLDAFFVSVECLKNPKFKSKPLIVGGSSERGVVVCCSYEARKFGVHAEALTNFTLIPLAWIDFSDAAALLPTLRGK